MACNITLSGIPVDCQPSLGGIKKVYIADYNDVASVTVSDDEITGITMNATKKFKTYNFRKNTGSLTSTLNVDDTTGNNYVTNVVSLVFSKMETAKRVEIAAMSVGQMAIIVEDCNGKLWYIGKDDYASATNGSANSGTAKSDANGYTIEISADSDTYPLEVQAAALTDIVE